MRLALTALVIVAGAATTEGRADTGTYHCCLIEGAAAAAVYMDASGRAVTFDVRGQRYEIRAQGGRFKLKVGTRFYAFHPRFGQSPAILVITTPNERRTVQCFET